MIAVVAGASGLVGREVVSQLLETSSIETVIAVGRSRLGLEHRKLREVSISSLSDLRSVHTELKGDAYLCCLGTTIKKAGSQEAFRKVDHDAIVAFGEVAKTNVAKSFVLVSAAGANAKSNFFYNRVKGETERDLAAMNLSSLTIFRPGLLMGARQEFRLTEKAAVIVGTVASAVLPKRVSRAVMTHADQLAQHMIATAIVAKPGLTVIEARDI